MTSNRLPRIKAFFLGKTTSYRLNAYDDAIMARLLIDYVNSGQRPLGSAPTDQRAARLIDLTPEDKHDERLIIQAFTLHHLNGYADLMWARWMEKTYRIAPIIVEPEHYGVEEEEGPVRLWFWMYLLRKETHPFADYADEQCGVSLTLSRAEIAEEIIRIQIENGAFNHTIKAHLLDQSDIDDPKVRAIQTLAEQQRHPRIFLVSAARTQAAASAWDKAFKLGLRYVFAS